MWNKIFIREKLVKSSVLCPEQLTFEDLDFWFRYYISQEPVVYLINDIYYGYRQREGSLTHSLHRKIDYITVFDRLYQTLSKESENKQKKYRKLYIKYFSDIMFIYDYLSNLDNEKEYKEVTGELCELVKKINLSNEEIKTYLGIDFYKILFTNKHVSELFIQSILDIKNKKYMFIKENLLLYKIRREVLRLFGVLE